MSTMAGPCKWCGATNYGLSTSGPDYCGACACGVDPRLTQFRRRAEEASDKYIDTLFAIQILTKTRYLFTDKMRQRGQAFLDKYLKEAKSKDLGPANQEDAQ